MNKPYNIYTPLTRAIDNYCDRHFVTREYIAREVGYCGDNASIQLSTALNPNSQKSISHEREQHILQSLDAEAQSLYFSLRTKEYGLSVSMDAKNTPVLMDMSFSPIADEAIMEGNEAFTCIKKCLKDSALSKKELEVIRKEAAEAVARYQHIVDVAEKRLEVE